MRKGGGKSKGGAFEREIAKKLSLWLSSGVNEDVLWRSAGSGSRSTVGQRTGKVLGNHAGDLVCNDPCGQSFIKQFYLELKFYKDLQYEGLLSGKGHLVKFWLEAQKQAAIYQKRPMLIAKQNMQPTVVCLDRTGIRFLGFPEVTISAPRLNLYIILFDELTKRGRYEGKAPRATLSKT